MSLTLSKDLIDWSNPINWGHPLNRGLVSWWLAVPGQNGWGTTRWRDMVHRSQVHGALTNMDPSTDWVNSGYRTGSIALDGDNDYIDVSAVTPKLTTEASLVIVLKLENATPATAAKSGFVSLTEVDTSGAASNATSHYPLNSDSKAYMNTFLSTRYNAITLSSSVNRAQWHQVTITTKPGANGWNFYQNEQLILSSTGEASLTLESTGWIGASRKFGNPSFMLNGNIQSVRILDRYMTSVDVAATYQAYRNSHAGLLNRGHIPRYVIQQAATGSPWHYYHQQAIACSREEGI